MPPAHRFRTRPGFESLERGGAPDQPGKHPLDLVHAPDQGGIRTATFIILL